MFGNNKKGKVTLTLIIPCFNEEKTLTRCVERVRKIADEALLLEIIIVDDASTDRSLKVAEALQKKYPEINVLTHKKNQGKGAALRTGIKHAHGDFVAVQDADMEYNPHDLKRLLPPLIEGEADVVFGSRFISGGSNRVLYFWHYLGNKILTFLSNMFTDLNLTDMETGYKVFKRDVIQSIKISENRFGFEPEIVARVAQRRLRIFEIGIGYHGRTYAEGKKIGFKDGMRALYCIFRYNASHAPIPIQLVFYLFFGAFSAIVNLFVFLHLYNQAWDVLYAAPIAFVVAAFINYALCITILFRHRARWTSITEVFIFLLVVALVGFVDMLITKYAIMHGASPVWAKINATIVCAFLNYLGRRFLVFPEPSTGPWQPSETVKEEKS